MSKIGKGKTQETIFSKLMYLFLPREKIQIIWLCLALILMGAFQVFGVASVLPFINLIMRPELIEENQWFSLIFNELGFTSPESFIFFIGVLMVLIIVFSNAVSAFTIWIKFRFIYSRNHRISRTLLRKYMYRPYEFFLDKNTSEMQKNILDEVNLMTESFLLPLIELISRAVIVFLLFVFLLIINPIVTLIALLFLGGGYYIANVLLKTKLKKGGQERVEANRMRYKTVGEALSGIKEIKIAGQEDYYIKDYSTHSWKFARVNAFRNMAGLLPKFLLEALSFGGIILLVLFLFSSRQNPQEVIPLVTLFAFAGYRLMPSLQVIYNSVAHIYGNQATLDNIYQEMLEYEKKHQKLKERNEKSTSITFKQYLELKNVDYSYPGAAEKAIKDVSFNIPRGSQVGIVGPTGAGKTTLVDLILGLLKPNSGEIFIDGVELDHNNVRSWQKVLGYVPQDIFLHDSTIASNIAFGVPPNEIDYEMVETAARIACLHDFIENELSNGYATRVGERGIKLSGGQKQRLGMARAIYRKPEILVLDEATSALDGSTEEKVMSALQENSFVETIIIIAHRLNTVKDCDNIYLFERGKLVETGDFESLINSSDTFRAMARLKNQK